MRGIKPTTFRANLGYFGLCKSGNIEFSQNRRVDTPTASISHNFDSKIHLRIELDLLVPITSCSAQFGTGFHSNDRRQVAPHSVGPAAGSGGENGILSPQKWTFSLLNFILFRGAAARIPPGNCHEMPQNDRFFAPLWRLVCNYSRGALLQFFLCVCKNKFTTDPGGHGFGCALCVRRSFLSPKKVVGLIPRNRNASRTSPI